MTTSTLYTPTSLSPLEVLLVQEQREHDPDALRRDSHRLSRLIAWLSCPENRSLLPTTLIREWTDPEDARAAIDEAVML